MHIFFFFLNVASFLFIPGNSAMLNYTLTNSKELIVRMQFTFLFSSILNKQKYLSSHSGSIQLANTN